jgi:hypothetical protein
LYATISQLKNELGIPTSDTSQDTYLTDLLTRVSAWIETYTGRKFGNEPTTVASEYHSREGSVLWLRNVGIASIVTVAVRDSVNDSWENLTSTDFEWAPDGRLELNSEYEYVKVSYTYGGAGIPKEIEQAAVSIAARIYRNSSIKSEQIGDYKIEFQAVKDITPVDELRALDLYRIPNV